MVEVLRRIFIFALIATIVSYLVFMVAGASLYAGSQSREKPVWVRDEITPNTHHLAGMVPVKSSCMELTEKTEQLSPVLYKLNFTTWEHPNTECTSDPVQKEFYEIIFAPAIGISFIAALDGAPLPVMVVPYAPTK